MNVSDTTEVTPEFLRTADEKALRECVDPCPKTFKDLAAVIEALTQRDQDYGTCVYSMSIASVATFHYVASVVGATGFQASCADLDILTRTRHMKRFRVQDFGNLLYPQYEHEFADWQKLIAENAAWLKEEAAALLAKSGEHTHPNVVAHWKWLAEMKIKS